MHTQPKSRSHRTRKLPATILALMIPLLTFSACSAFPGGDLRRKYVEMVQRQGLTPVYPPREEFQVGDIFMRSYSTRNTSDLNTRAIVWLGTIDSLRVISNKYLNTRFDLKQTGEGTNNELELNQADLTDGGVQKNANTRTSLPIVAFPSISGSAASAGAFGGLGFLSSFGLAIGTSEKVSLDLTDTRVFGLPLASPQLDGTYEQEFNAIICSRAFEDGGSIVKIGRERLEIVAGHLGVDTTRMCSHGRKCDIAVITRTYLTRKLTFNYSSTRIARLAAASRIAPTGVPQTTVPLPGNLSLDVTLDPDDDGKQAAALSSGISKAVETSPAQSDETAGLQFLGFQGNTLAFTRTFARPVAVAYDSINLDVNSEIDACERAANH